jgi:hypothetical protein
MPKKRGGVLGQRPLWIITSQQNNRMDVLTIHQDDDRELLAVFSFEEEAETFLCLLGDGEKKKKGWSSRETTPGELVSVLLGPCANAQGVALDPLPLSLTGWMLPLVSVKHELFVQELLIGESRRLEQALVRA